MCARVRLQTDRGTMVPCSCRCVAICGQGRGADANKQFWWLVRSISRHAGLSIPPRPSLPPALLYAAPLTVRSFFPLALSSPTLISPSLTSYLALLSSDPPRARSLSLPPPGAILLHRRLWRHPPPRANLRFGRWSRRVEGPGEPGNLKKSPRRARKHRRTQRHFVVFVARQGPLPTSQPT